METIISGKNLYKAYKSGDGSDFYATNNISIDIAKGQLTILKGRSGSGKTTLMNCISGLDDVTEGEIFFMGDSLTKMSPAKREKLRRTNMGFVFQSIALIPVMTAYENVDFALRLAGIEKRDARIRQLLDRVGLKKRMDHMAGQLSGGEQQRVAIARAVAHRPGVIFADEPTGALDTASGLAVMKLFRELVRDEGVTIVMTTHDPNLMELADTVYEIEDGAIVKTQHYDHSESVPVDEKEAEGNE